MNKLARAQRGLTLWSGLFVFGSIAFVALCLIKIGPLFLNEFQLRRAVHDVGQKEAAVGGQVDMDAIQRALQRRWDIDYISQVEPQDVHIVRTEKGLFLSYDYEARVSLFANISVLVRFQDDEPLRASVD